MTISYAVELDVPVEDVVDVYRDAGLERRPTDDPERMQRMVSEADLLVTAREDERLVGLARSLTDGTYVTYLSDLAVRRSHQRLGIGEELIDHTRRAAPQAKLVLLAAPAARSYYPRIGFTIHRSAWTLPPLS